MSYIPSDNSVFNRNIAENTRVAQMTTLLDGKVLGQDDADLWDNVGTGTGLFVENSVNLSVTAGQYEISQTKRTVPYFSGKTQLVEITFNNFQTEGDCIKRAGYFTSSTVTPYTSGFDGFFIEENAGVKSLQMYRNGVQVVNVLFTAMDNYSKIASYNWENFTVTGFDFLWLGGAGLRFFVKLDEGFVLVHTVKWAGNNVNTFMLSPNQPVRYEIRSTASTGSFKRICSQVATEGSTKEAGKTLSFYNTISVATNSIGEIYPLIAVRKSNSFRDIATQIVEMGIVATASADAGILMLIKNGTQTGTPMTFSASGKIEVSYNSAANQRITANTGIMIATAPVSQFGQISNIMSENFLSMLTGSIAGVNDIYYLCIMPTTSNQSNNASLTLKEY